MMFAPRAERHGAALRRVDAAVAGFRERVRLRRELLEGSDPENFGNPSTAAPSAALVEESGARESVLPGAATLNQGLRAGGKG
jgi:hypothetical protein